MNGPLGSPEFRAFLNPETAITVRWWDEGSCALVLGDPGDPQLSLTGAEADMRRLATAILARLDGAS